MPAHYEPCLSVALMGAFGGVCVWGGGGRGPAPRVRARARRRIKFLARVAPRARARVAQNKGTFLQRVSIAFDLT